jgi:hypothetical protein
MKIGNKRIKIGRNLPRIGRNRSRFGFITSSVAYFEVYFFLVMSSFIATSTVTPFS